MTGKTDAGEWKKTLESLKAELDALQPSGDGWHIPPSAHVSIKTAFTRDSDVNRLMYIFGQLDAGKMAHFAAAGDLPWWPVIYGRAFFNDLDGLREVYASAPVNEKQGGAAGALKWIAEPYTLGDGVRNDISAKVIRQLCEWGASPNSDNGKWLERSLRTLNAEAIRTLVAFEADPKVIFRVMGEMLDKNNFKQAGKIQDALARATVWFKVDDHTLSETKFVITPEGGASFKALFNFRSRRVNEIYESVTPAKPPTMTSVAFGDYDREAIGFAEKQFEKLGGKLPDPLGKPRFKGLSA